jgi:isopenicillin N synthase-like dioxygenase
MQYIFTLKFFFLSKHVIICPTCDWQLVNHGVPDEVIAGVKRDIENFFQLPLNVKNAYAQRPGDLQGYGQAFVQSNDQKLDWSDMFALYTQPPQARGMSYWPS